MISKLRILTDHLSSEVDFYVALHLFSLAACPSDAPSRLFIGRVDLGPRLTRVAGFGFEEVEGVLDQYAQSFKPELLSEAIRSELIVIQNHNQSFVDDLHKQSGFHEDAKWRTTFWMPLLPDYFASLSISIEVKYSESEWEYFKALRSILDLHLKSHGRNIRINLGGAFNRKSAFDNSQLSERQRLILELIEAGETNSEIADRLGYSESLIRKESMAIYREIGIAGRRDLAIVSRGRLNDEPTNIQKN